MQKKVFLLSLLASTSVFAGDCYDTCYPYAVTPPTVRGCCGVDFSISYLYVKPKADSFFWAENISGVGIDSPQSQADNLGIYEPQNYEFDWQSGFEVELGYQLHCDKWKISASWMNIDADQDKAITGIAQVLQASPTGPFGGNVVFPLGFPIGGYFGFGADGTLFTNVASHFVFQFNQLDLLLSREGKLGNHLSFSPFFGLRALFLKNKVDTTFDYLFQSNNPEEGFSEAHLKNNYRSIGVVGGFNAFYHFGCGLGFSGDLSAALLYGRNRVQMNVQHESSENDILYGFEGEVGYSNWQLRPELDLFLGIEWRDCGNCGLGEMFVKAGWENHYFFNALEDPSIGGSDTPNVTNTLKDNLYNMSITGIRISAGVSF